MTAQDAAHQNKAMAAVNDVLRPGDGGFREAVCITGQQSRAADVCCGVDVGLPGTDGGKNWKEKIEVTKLNERMKYEYR